jgi:hypothetical protein
MKEMFVTAALLVICMGLVGCRGDDFSPSVWLRLNNFDIVNRTGDQDRPDAAYSHYKREYFVVWQDGRSGVFNVYGKRIDDRSGAAVASELSISDNTSIAMATPRVALSPEDSVYLVVWDDSRNARHDVYGQLVNELTGALVGGNFAIDSTAGNKYNPRVAYNSENRTFFVVYETGDGTAKDIYGVVVATDGSASPRIALETDAANQKHPAVAYNSEDNSFLVCWEDYRTETLTSDIWGVVCDGDGVPGTPAEIYAGDDLQTYPALAYAPGARNCYLLTWEDHSEGDAEIFTMIVNPSGVATATAVNITSSYWQQTGPAVAYDPHSDQFVVAWKDNYNDTDDIFAQIVTGAGVRKDEFTMVSQDRWNGNEHYPAIALNTWDHEFLFVFGFDLNGDWDIAGQFGD